MFKKLLYLPNEISNDFIINNCLNNLIDYKIFYYEKNNNNYIYQTNEKLYYNAYTFLNLLLFKKK